MDQLRVVVADDSSIMRERFKAAVLAAGHEVVAAAKSGRDALKLCKELKPDAAILDVAMPPGSGSATARELATDKIVPRVLVVSSNSQDMIFRPLHALGVRTLVKPCGDPILHATVKAFLNGGD